MGEGPQLPSTLCLKPLQIVESPARNSPPRSILTTAGPAVLLPREGAAGFQGSVRGFKECRVATPKAVDHTAPVERLLRLRDSSSKFRLIIIAIIGNMVLITHIGLYELLLLCRYLKQHSRRAITILVVKIRRNQATEALNPKPSPYTRQLHLKPQTRNLTP